MSLNRFDTRVDLSQRSLVSSLRAVGVQVWIIRKPSDLLLRFWCNRHHEFCWQPLECKVANRKDGSYRPRKAQNAQTQFLIETQTPIATSFGDAIAKLNQRHQ